MNGIFADSGSSQSLANNKSERLDGLIACIAFLDTFTREAESAGLSNPLLPQG